MLLTEEQEQIRNTAREFARRFLARALFAKHRGENGPDNVRD
jgi:hypothetical protein